MFNTFKNILLKISKLFFNHASIVDADYAVANMLNEELFIPNKKASPAVKIEVDMSKLKREFFEKSLKDGIVRLNFEPGMPGVQVPRQFCDLKILTLDFSYAFNISDFVFDNEKVVATLSFNKQPYRCVVPWDSVRDVINQTTGECFFPELLNDIIEKDSLTLVQPTEKDPNEVFPVREKPKLTLIKGGKA